MSTNDVGESRTRLGVALGEASAKRAADRAIAAIRGMVMSNPPIPDDVRAFLREQLDSFEKLEALLLLTAAPGSGWSPFAVGERLGMPASLAVATLEELRVLGLADLEADGRYAYTGPVLAVIQKLTRLYEQDRVGIVMFLNATAMNRIRGSAARAFADAFRVRPAKDDKGDNHG